MFMTSSLYSSTCTCMVSSCIKDDASIVYKHFSQNERKATEYGILNDIKGDLHVEEKQATNRY